jgi:anaerobic selenocysteine-containing dehydrogenase
MSSIQHSDTNVSTPAHRSTTGLWSSLKLLWCRHRDTATTPKAPGMPAHIVCRSCGWREPLLASVPQGTRTWDSTRDEARYQLEKRRREAVEAQRQMVVARLATPAPRRFRRPRAESGNLLHMQPAVGE